MAIMNWDSALSALACAAISLWGLLATAAVESISQKNPPNSRSHMRSRRNSNPCRAAARCCSVPNGYSPYQNQLGFRLNSTLFDTKEWPSTLLHGHISASRTVLFFRIIITIHVHIVFGSATYRNASAAGVLSGSRSITVYLLEDPSFTLSVHRQTDFQGHVKIPAGGRYAVGVVGSDGRVGLSSDGRWEKDVWEGSPLPQAPRAKRFRRVGWGG